jgi:hypothetical protein
VKKVCGIDEKAFINMPSTKDRAHIEFDELDDRRLGTMVDFAEAVVKSLCELIYPCDINP